MYLNNQIKHEDHVGVFESGLQNLQNSEKKNKNSPKIQKNSENENQTFTMYLNVFCAEVSKIIKLLKIIFISFYCFYTAFHTNLKKNKIKRGIEGKKYMCTSETVTSLQIIITRLI